MMKPVLPQLENRPPPALEAIVQFVSVTAQASVPGEIIAILPSCVDAVLPVMRQFVIADVPPEKY